MFQTHPAPEISHKDIFGPPSAAHPAYYDPHCMGYVPYYGPIVPVSLFTDRNLRSLGVRVFFTE